MSRIDDLIQELCPDGVEHKTLGGAGKFIRGSGLQKADLREEGVPAVHYGQIHTFYGVYATETKSFTDPVIAAKLRHAQPGDLLIATTSEDDDAVAKATAWLGDSDVVLGGDAYIYRHELDPKYMAYFFQSSSFQYQKRRFISGTKVRRVSGASLEKIRIPVPPLEVQREIVRVLDKFTQLEAELEAELEARRAQYAHYRRELLSGGDAASGRMIPLGEIFEMRAGTHIKAAEISDEPTEEKPYPCYGGNGLRGYVSSYNYDESVIFVGRQGALCGNVHRAEGKTYATEHAVVVTPKVAVDMSWAFHKLTEMDLNQYKTKSAQPGLAVGRVKQVEAQYVPVDDQRRDGEVLDKLDALVNDISIGLPAELTARRKQYEYYRDHLLSFKEAI
ncbi:MULTISPECIES: restriction endonuclease subunit S [Kocuria]|uniref:Restriction endonuclease subunit S n=1 Tax=Kocuria subflava TaxID=1736139 RepID=A0A846TMT4_9MICC|nr:MULTISPECIES: restriction endonuclease subunit S [Kocuria]NKE09753.1 restriction endonuclease subunit S [Kocuria subflava]